MIDYTVRYSGKGTGVLRTEVVAARDELAVQDYVKQRLGGSRAFEEASVFEADCPRFRLASGRLGVTEV